MRHFRVPNGIASAPFAVVLDANVLYPFVLRDTLLRAAQRRFYAPHWSQQILEEATRNLVANKQMSMANAARLCSRLRSAFPESFVDNYEHLIEAMQNDPKDRHVAAVAVQCRAQLIVTSNLRDFKSLPSGIEAQSPDDFLCDLYDLDPIEFKTLVVEQASSYMRPSRAFADVVDALKKTCPHFAALLRS